MLLFEQIKKDQITARKNKEQVRASLLTTLMGEGQTQAKNKGVEVLSDEDTVALVKKFLKGNAEFLAGNVPAEKLSILTTEKGVLECYLPKQLADVQIRDTIRGYFKEGIVKKGDVMKKLKEQYNGMYDGKRASDIFSEVEKDN